MPLDDPAPSLAARLRRETQGEILFDPFSRGRYATDASIYQIEPLGVLVPKSRDDIQAALAIARAEGVPVLPRGAGTSQCGQTVARALVIDCSKYLNRVVAVDTALKRARVEPGVVLDPLNRLLRQEGLFFPVDPSTASRATLGGMAANNSCGSRSLRYGNMVHNVRAIEAILADGTAARFAEVPGNFDDIGVPAGSPIPRGGAVGPERYRDLVRRLRALHARERDEIARRFPRVLRRVGGYNIDTISDEGHNMARLLVGSEGTLAFFTEIELDLQPIPADRVLGICHFPSFYGAMDATRHIVKLAPSAVELVDRTMIDLARGIALFRPIVERFVRGEPEAILLVEFSGDDPALNRRQLRALGELMGDLGFPDSVVEAVDPAFQQQVWGVRAQGLNIMMSMKGDGKPISFIEDCAVRLEDLADYTDRLSRIFAKYGTYGTWYAHASVGCLHVRPVLNVKQELDVKKMRAIAEEAFAMVREYKGSHSGEHGDGLVRSEFHEAMFGGRIVRAFEEVKDAFDPGGLFNPGKIVRAPKMDDRSLFRFPPNYRQLPVETALDWSEWGGFAAAAEMCNNNGACRARDAGVMCPSFRATGDEQHLTRGRANTLRLALSGQLGRAALLAPEMRETLDLCISCKGCKRECPTGVDMARMKVEFLSHWRKRYGLTRRDRLFAYLPRYAPLAARLAPLLNLRNRLPFLARLGERQLGLSARRRLPEWSSHPYRAAAEGRGPSVTLFVDTFNRYFEPENARAAARILLRAGYRVESPDPPKGRPLCCGRTFLAAGLVDEARTEAKRMLDALAPVLDAGTPVVGLEPSCLLTLRDELPVLLPGEAAKALAARARLFEEFVAEESAAGRFAMPLSAMPGRRALLHGHCHQKAFNTVGAAVEALRLIPDLAVETFDSTCCGMAGSFGYEAEHYDMSLRIGELSVLPTLRAAPPDTILAANGTSCRHQIADALGREARHVVRILDEASCAPAP
ncbi:MAG TPA: FAD-linked oxidase C-terminal domain-containing protein [Stellaceae bacterium]|nr:FAD-linked oxidase C-terminal domain-containing protein [Stellaceae bacterium]